MSTIIVSTDNLYSTAVYIKSLTPIDSMQNQFSESVFPVPFNQQKILLDGTKQSTAIGEVAPTSTTYWITG